MKYTAKQRTDGKWAVFTGKKYFVDSVTDDEKEAKLDAVKRSGQWYMDQVDKCQAYIEKIDPEFCQNDPHVWRS